MVKIKKMKIKELKENMVNNNKFCQYITLKKKKNETILKQNLKKISIQYKIIII